MIFSKEVAEAIAKITKQETTAIASLLQTPKESNHGDIAFPCFLLAKEQKKSPVHVAQALAQELHLEFGTATAIGPYVNISIDANIFIPPILTAIHKAEKIINHTKNQNLERNKQNADPRTPNPEPQTQTPEPRTQNLDPSSPIPVRRILIESPSPNTNKPLHLGHLRNMLLGHALTSLKRALGQEVVIVNLINDRGVHICKSMLAYKKWGNTQTPERIGMKSDHFVGDWYVRFNKEAKLNPSLEQEAQDLLVAWEKGDAEVLALWKQMNEWAHQGFKETYELVGFPIDKNYFESDIYLFGKEIILQGVKDNVFFTDETGAVIVDLSKQKLDKKVLLRKDGTSVYITQDIFLAKQRFDEYQFDELIYIVGNEQEYHFQVLFEIFKRLQYPFAQQCKHFSYGMVELPEGKMKSREGNVIDIDELYSQTITLAKEAVEERFSDINAQEVEERAQLIAHGAIRFFFLKFDPTKNFVFDPKASLSFEGETGPYVQYTHARICSILRKNDASIATNDFALLVEPEEKELVKLLATYNNVVVEAAEKLKPNLLCNYLLALSQSFNSYYSKHKIIQDDKTMQSQRIGLLVAINKVIKEALDLLGIKAPERM